MFCKVCSREINVGIFETIGNQIVCSLSCVGLLQANEEDKCNVCQRPVWRDNYYKIDSLFYCSEKCKKKVVKNHLKKFNTIQDININHIENEFFKNDSPMKNLKELRKEVKEFYKDFDYDETATIKSIPISCKSTFNYKDNQNNINIVDNYKDSINNMSVTQPKNMKQNFSMKKYVKKYPVIPNRYSKNSITNNKSFYKEKRSLSRQKNIENFLKKRKNYSFDNKTKYFNYQENDDEITCHLMYVNRRNNSINNDQNYNKRAKLKQTFLKFKNNNIPILKTKLDKNQIPNPIFYQHNLKGNNNSKYNNYRYYEGLYENKENQNITNVPCLTGNYFEKHYFKNDNIINNEKNNMNQNFIERNDIYRYEDVDYKIMNTPNF